ncbi:MAG: electron transfer flavoprotein subunit beta/FixA family protein [Desulfobacteraceae bacterium]|nr:electron transfer flavoprotein subunit beta/FixA family protein [Desulfobacteraceae bacterium]
MKILVTIKPVFEEIQMTDPDILEKNFHKQNPDLNYKINRFDDHALEEALKLKEQSNTIQIFTISVGTKQSLDILKKTIGKGADKAFLIETETKNANDPDFVSDAVKDIFMENSCDLLFCGMMSEDMMNGVTGLLTASKLSIPSLSGITFIEDISSEKIVVKRELEGGTAQKAELSLPCALNFQAGINKPGYPNVMRMLKADETSIIVKSTENTDFKNSTEINDLKLPSKTRKGEILQGSIEDKAKAFVEILKQKKIL